jgi:hypothetical protein
MALRRPLCCIGGLLALTLAASEPLLAQPTETCSISPHPPAFTSAGQEVRLHGLPHPGAAPHTAFHGQGLHGRDTLYFSHLAVFMGRPDAHPHNFQVILEVEFDDPEAKATYDADRAQHPDVIYTVVPPRFDQTALVAEYLGHDPLRRFPETTVFRGHFEQDGVPIIENVGFEIRRIVHFREFLLGGPKLEEQNYLLFGRSADVFLSHMLSAPPDFDQILLVKLDMQDVPTDTIARLVEQLLAQGLYLWLPGRENSTATRLRSGDTLTCSLETGTRALPVTVVLRVMEESYCEEGEFVRLVMDRFNDPRPCQG